jgi:hypothetical protein
MPIVLCKEPAAPGSNLNFRGRIPKYNLQQLPLNQASLEPTATTTSIKPGSTLLAGVAVIILRGKRNGLLTSSADFLSSTASSIRRSRNLHVSAKPAQTIDLSLNRSMLLINGTNGRLVHRPDPRPRMTNLGFQKAPLSPKESSSSVS